MVEKVGGRIGLNKSQVTCPPSVLVERMVGMVLTCSQSRWNGNCGSSDDCQIQMRMCSTLTNTSLMTFYSFIHYSDIGVLTIDDEMTTPPNRIHFFTQDVKKTY
jgi:hypothetical protein